MTRAKTRSSKTDVRLDEILEGCQSPEDIFGKHGLVKQLTKRLVERALRAELTEHLGYVPHASESLGSDNIRNESLAKTVQTAKPLSTFARQQAGARPRITAPFSYNLLPAAHPAMDTVCGSLSPTFIYIDSLREPLCRKDMPQFLEIGHSLARIPFSIL